MFPPPRVVCTLDSIFFVMVVRHRVRDLRHSRLVLPGSISPLDEFPSSSNSRHLFLVLNKYRPDEFTALSCSVPFSPWSSPVFSPSFPSSNSPASCILFSSLLGVFLAETAKLRSFYSFPFWTPLSLFFRLRYLLTPFL